MPKPIAAAVISLLSLLFIVLISAAPSTQAGTTAPSVPDPQFGTDSIVNGTAQPSPIAILAKNVTLSINPTNSNNIVASYDDFHQELLKSGYAASTDGGRTWISGDLQGPWGPNNMDPFGVTNVKFDGHGVAYYTTLALSPDNTGYFVLTSTNGLNWNTPVPVVITDNYQGRYESDLSIDTRTSGPYAGSLYNFWLFTTSSPPFYQGITLRYSRDGARTWSNDVTASDPQNLLGRGPSSTVASNGTLYVAFEVTENLYIYNQPELYITRSTDGGQTWDADHLIGGGPITQIGISDYKARELVLKASDKCGMIRINHFPSIAVSPLDPDTVYAVWNDGRWEANVIESCTTVGKHSDIALSRSTDGGLTWSAPIRVNDDPIANRVDQFQPTVAVHADGTVGVSWYDRRYATNPYYYDLAYTQSTDGGVTWRPNIRVSDTSSNPEYVPDYKGIDDVGYRKSLLFGTDFVLPGWVDTHEGIREGDVYVDRGSFNTVVPTSTSTATTPSTATRTATSVISSPTRTPTNAPTNTPGTGTPTPTPCAIQFSDVPTENTFYASIQCLVCRGIVSGYADGTFKPNNQVTRGQLAKMVSNAAGYSEPVVGQTFEDIPPSHTFYEFIQRLTARGHMTGYPCTPGSLEPCVAPNNRPYFRPNSNATRGQTSKIVANAAMFTEPVGGQTFQDVPTNHTFYEFIQRLATRNVMGGYPCGGVGEPCVGGRPYFRPGNDVTRGQSAKIVANTFFPECSP